MPSFFFFFNDTATTEIYTLSLHDALPISVSLAFVAAHTQRVKLGTGIIILPQRNPLVLAKELASVDVRSEEHTSELQSQSNLVCRLLLEKKKPRHSPPSTYPSRSSHVPVP